MRPYHFALLAIGLGTVVPAHAAPAGCTPITALPSVISNPGVYCLTGDLTYYPNSGTAITIGAGHVTLDLDGWTLSGQSSGSGTQAVGIQSSFADVTVMNGTVHGFKRGIGLAGSGGVVKGIVADANTTEGIGTGGANSVVEHNKVFNTGGSTTSPDVFAYGIRCSGRGTVVSDNTVSSVSATGSASEYGISVTGPNSVARDNVVIDDSKPTGGGKSYGIYNYVATSVGNTVVNFRYGIYALDYGFYTQNTVYNSTTSFYGGTKGAGNSSDQ